MPMYEYECKSCGHEFETIQKFSDAPIKVCPECTGPTEKKLSVSSSFSLKGSGWYKDGYAKNSAGCPSKCESCPAKDS